MSGLTRSSIANRAQIITRADGLWDILVGIVLCIVPISACAKAFGLPPARPWPVFVVVGIGSFAYAAGLLKASRTQKTAADACPPAAIGNGIAAIAAVVLASAIPGLKSGGLATLAIGGAGCALFSVLEWRVGLAGRRSAQSQVRA